MGGSNSGWKSLSHRNSTQGEQSEKKQEKAGISPWSDHPWNFDPSKITIYSGSTQTKRSRSEDLFGSENITYVGKLPARRHYSSIRSLTLLILGVSEALALSLVLTLL